ncbi:hypothetical protein L3556_13080 [Candidatus Synechococcus calcipolaris G9]|uniref:Uncharacterized protein n=1 Tax=Candidatus Synechococcus calcipolaris G9 TaxID=1497997 RepID=A0ABT6F1W8_9SYNE|nr:hypothetical protein [Candidatus Synechococcus calcipolaris]MDG2991855.1 hypothetical protein [Candidatus Synechococcus calcipolaris G9]
MNTKIKWLIHDNYYCIVLSIFIILIIFVPVLYVCGKDWKVLLTLVGSLLSFFYFLQKQQLDEAKFLNELFIQFNQRYDRLNEEMNDILANDKISKEKELEDNEIDTLNDYFNLCAEEYLFYRRGYIYPEVWKSWVAGMNTFYDDNRIQKLWLKELSAQSYYSFNVSNEIKQLP